MFIIPDVLYKILFSSVSIPLLESIFVSLSSSISIFVVSLWIYSVGISGNINLSRSSTFLVKFVLRIYPLHVTVLEVEL